jgi:hypothetical protein
MLTPLLLGLRNHAPLLLLLLLLLLLVLVLLVLLLVRCRTTATGRDGSIVRVRAVVYRGVYSASS